MRTYLRESSEFASLDERSLLTVLDLLVEAFGALCAVVLLRVSIVSLPLTVML